MSRSSTPSSETAAHEQLSTPRTLSLVETPCVLCGSHESEPSASGYDFEYDTVPDLFHFVRCRECDHLYLKPRPSAADLPIIYPSNYYAFSGEPNPIVAPLRRYWESGKVRLYADLMGHWQAVLPNPFLEIGFEELFADRAALNHRLGEFCGVELPDAPVPPPDPIGPIFDVSGYDAHLAPLKDAFNG